MIDVKGKNIVVTGGGRGIGKAICLTLAEGGANVAVANRTLEHAEKVSAEAAKVGVKSFPIQVDVSDEASVANMVEEALKEFDTIDVLINNAGICKPMSVEETTLESWNTNLNINLTGVFLCCKAILPQMKKQGYGKILNTASQSSKDPAANYAHYCASKAGVMLFSRSLALEVVEDGISVNCVCPGPVDTDMMQEEAEIAHAATGRPVDELIKEWNAAVPMGRYGKPEEIANLFLFLASDACSFMTGEDINISGGQTMF